MEELKGLMEVVVVCVEGDDGVPNDDVSVRQWGLEEESVGEREGEASVVEAWRRGRGGWWGGKGG